jgi:uncharacterized protein (DUF305 family)
MNGFTMRTQFTRTSLLVAAAVAAALTFSGCAGGAPEAGSGSTASFAEPDIEFAQMMIPHHEQAVEMSDEILAKDGVDEAVVDLATRIKAAQEPEIKQLGSWLDAWDADRGMAGMDHGTDGMMSDDDMAALADASGAAAGELFLEQMVIHHEGAIAMAKTQLETGKNAEAKAMAEAIVTGQTEEITVMKDLLAGR